MRRRGEMERGFLDSRSQGSREEGHLEPGLERRSRSWGPELGRWSRSRGPREEGCSNEEEHEEEEGLKRTWYKVIRVMHMQRLRSKGEMDWRRRDSEVQVIPNLCEMNWLGCGTTTTDCHRHGLHHRTAASNTTSATSSTRRHVVKTVMTWTVCIGVRVCDEWSLARFVEYYLLSRTRVYVNGMQ